MTTKHADIGIEILLPRQIQDLLNACPSAGSGVHNWLIRVAVRLHRYFANKDDIAELLWKYSANCGRDVGESEVWAAINDSARWLARQEGQCVKGPSTPKWPER